MNGLLKELTEEVSAFANAAGVVLLISVNDDNQIVGATIDNQKRSAIQNSLGEISPHLNCMLSVVEVDGKQIGVIEVPSGPNKPYVLSGAIYVRVGPNTQKLTTAEQMRDFFQQSERIYFDEAPCHSFDPATMVDQDFVPLFKTEAVISTTVSDEQVFRNLKLYSNQKSFKNGAILFFRREPEAIFDKAIVRCVAFQGIDKRFIIDDKVFGGNLYNQYRQAMNWLRGKLNVRYDIEGQGSGPRKELWEIPETVFKEAIINSLSHRDYYDRGAVTVMKSSTTGWKFPTGAVWSAPSRRPDSKNRTLPANPCFLDELLGYTWQRRSFRPPPPGEPQQQKQRTKAPPKPYFCAQNPFPVATPRYRKYPCAPDQQPRDPPGKSAPPGAQRHAELRH